ITGASDDDPSGIATYTQAGAGFGFQFLWTAILTYPLTVTIQEMCGRIGMVTRNGLIGILRKNYPRPLMWMMIFLSFPAIVLNISANLAGMGAVSTLLIPSVPSSVFSTVFATVLLFNLIRLSYRKIATILQFLCLVLLCYVIVPFLSGQDWGRILKYTFIPSLEFNTKSISILVAIFGTTISPYLFFWQTSMEVEEVKEKKIMVDKQLIDDVRTDVRVGMFVTNFIFFFIILTAGAELFPKGITNIETVDQAAQALKPLVGESAYLLFALGVIGTGLLSIPVLAGSLSYMLSEAFGWKEGLNKKFRQAKGFYAVMIFSMLLALGIDLAGINPVKSLIFTAVLYGITAPILIGIIMHIGNNKKLMGKFTNRKTSNFFGALTLVIMTAAAITLIYLWINN
ncbi:MAG TPA: Nramp family divalent metal transporter, partial [Chitinophagaceae bacterium]|nr:Nramp family divalent metal transporter [Chitinophagaceae bacterium]